MIKWLKARTRQEKVMILFIILFIIGIILRWDYISKEIKTHVFKKGPVEEVITPPSGEQQDTVKQTEAALLDNL